MSQNRPARNPRALVLAFLMTFSVIATIPIGSEARHGDSTVSPEPATTLSVRPEPLWLTDAPTHSPDDPEPLLLFAPSNADPAKDIAKGQHFIRLYNQGQVDKTKIECLYTPPTEAQIADGAPHFYWVKEYSGARGWTVTVDNTAAHSGSTPNHRIITFTADPDAEVGGKLRRVPPTPAIPDPDFTQEFALGFRITGEGQAIPETLAPDRLDVQCIAYPGSISSAGTLQAPFDLTDRKPCDDEVDCVSFQIVLDNEPPVIRRAQTRDWCTDGTRTSLVTPNTGAPYIDSKAIHCLDGATPAAPRPDGHLDHIELFFSENLDPTTLDYTAFSVTDKGRPPYKVVGAYFEPFQMANIPDPVGAEPATGLPRVQRLTDRVTLVLEQQPFYDTGARENLKVIYSAAGGLQDLAGNRMRGVTSGVPVFDGAKPLIVGAWAIPDDSTVHVFFSEPIQGSGPVDSTCGLKTVQLGDITHRDDPVLFGTAADGNNIVDGGAQLDFIEAFQCTEYNDRLAITMKSNPDDAGRRFRFGARDSDPLKGDLIGSALDAAPLSCAAPPVAALDYFPCSARVKDAAGLTMWWDATNEPYRSVPGAMRRMTYPLVVRADMDVSHDSLRVLFNGPVRRHDLVVKPTEVDKLAPLVFSDFDIESAETADPNAGAGPSGVDGAYYLPPAAKQLTDTDTVLLKTDHPARSEDVDAVPARVIVTCDRIRASPAPGRDSAGLPNPNHYLIANNYPVFNSAAGRVPCANPDRFGYADEEETPNVDLVDITQPRIIEARTYDADHNGWLDGIELTFSEPVNDQSLSEDSVQEYLDSDCFNTVTGMGSEFCATLEPIFQVRLRDAADSSSRECFAPYRWDTGALTNDNKGIMGAVNVTKNVASGARFERVRDCKEVYLEKPTTLRHQTDHRLGLAITSPLLSDTATPPNTMPAYCDRPNALCHDEVRVRDGAPPVVMKATTVDTPVYNANGDVETKAPERQLHGDGFIDGYRVTFSEPIVDASFDPSNWEIGAEGEYTIPAKDAYRTRDLNLAKGDPTIALLVNDPELTILFAKGTKPDTEARPQLTYQRGSSAGLRDKAGNAMVDFGTVAVDEQDGAAPQLIAVSGIAGNAFVDLTFSEPVDDGARNVLVQADFQYSNRDAAKNPGGVAGKSGTVQVCHGDDSPQYPVPTTSAGCTAKPLDQARLPLDRPLTASDIANDRFQVIAGKVFEIAPSVTQKKDVPDYFRPLNVALDVTPPGPVVDLSVVAELTTANSAVLRWTAPGDDGQLGKPASYLVAVRAMNATTGPFENATGIEALVPEGVVVEFFTFVSEDEVEGAGAIVEAGKTQTLRLVGLSPQARYDVLVRAIDDANNLGAYQAPGGTSGLGSSLGEAGLVRTRTDSSPPTGTLVIQSKTHKANVANTAHNATFTWNELRDEESTVVYRYALNTNPDYIVLATDPGTQGRNFTRDNIAEGDWTFHVAAFSGGGAGKTAHYRFRIGPADIDASAILAANELLKDLTKAVREDGRNTVTWTLPPKDQIPGDAAQLRAVEIWRDDDGIFTLVDTIAGTYESLQNGTYTDVDPDASASSAYRVNMLFEGNQRQADPLEGYVALEDRSPEPFPLWLIVLLVAGATLAIAGIVIFAILRSKQRASATGGIAYAWESANADALGVDEATGLPVHNVKCPNCASPFQAVGNLPLPITCPNCSATGTLD